MQLSKSSMTIAAAVTTAVTVLVVMIAQGAEPTSGPPGSQTPAGPPPNSEPAVRSIGQDVAATVGVMRRSRSAADVLPADVAAYVDWAGIRGASGSLSRKAFSTDNGGVYVLPGNGVVCLLVTGRHGGASGPSCRTPQQLRSASGGPGAFGLDCTASSTGLESCAGALLVGIAPDGVEKVTVPLESGESVSARVVNNAYQIEVRGHPDRIRLETGSGVIEQQVAVP